MIPAATPIITGAISLLLLALSVFFARPWLAALISSVRIERGLKQLRGRGATVLNHALLAAERNNIIHIDHLIITNTEIIAISILGYSGEILGSVRSATWIQETRQGSYRFPNPLRHHEAIRNVLLGILGEQLPIRTISAFTSGRLKANVGDEVLTAHACAKVMQDLGETHAIGSKQNQASNIIQNVLLKDRREVVRERSFISHQGDEKQLRLARHLMVGSVVMMLLAIATAGLHLVANQGMP